MQNHLGGLSKIVLHGNKVKKSTVDAIKTYLRENHMDTESETTSDLDLTLSSITSETTSDDSSQIQVFVGLCALTYVFVNCFFSVRFQVKGTVTPILVSQNSHLHNTERISMRQLI